MDLTNSIKLLQNEREIALNVLQKYSDEQLLKTPQILHYMLSRSEMRIDKELVSIFRTGTSPSQWKTTPDIPNIKTLFTEIPELFLKDYKNGIFQEFRTYKTATGFELNTFEDAVTFNHFHEGTHLGIILGLIKRI